MASAGINAPGAVPEGTLHVLHRPGVDKSVSLRFEYDGKQRLLERPASEPLERSLQRMTRLQLSREAKKQLQREARDAAKAQGRKIQDVTEELMGRLPAARVFGDGGGELGAELAVADAFMRASAVELGRARFRVVQNPPTVLSMTADTARPMAGFPLLPRAELLNCAPAACLWAWDACAEGEQDREGAWERVAEGRGFTPPAALVGRRLRCSCAPRRGEGEGGLRAAEGTPRSVVYAGAVEAAAESALTAALAAFARAHGRAAGRPRARLRVASYNVLADVYACTRFAREHMFPYCAAELLDEDYRKPLLLAQLRAAEPDVACLQEVGTAFFERYMLPHARAAGFDGAHAEKGGAVAEGLAILFRADRFRLLAHLPVSLNDRQGAALQTDCILLAPPPDAPPAEDGDAAGDAAGDWQARLRRALAGSERELAARWRAHPALAEAMARVTTVGQLAVLEETPAAAAGAAPRRLCVANTHLFFHSNARHVRALQTAMLLRAAAHAADAAGASVVVCGDLNALPGTAAHDLLVAGGVGRDHPDWACGASFYWGAAKVTPPPAAPAAAAAAADDDDDEAGGAAEEGEGGSDRKRRRAGESAPAALPHPKADAEPLRLALASPVALFSACGEQPYTTIVNGFEGRLDYVTCAKGDFRPVAHLDALPRAVAAATGGMPSAQFPSDHLPQVADVEWVAGQEQP